MEVFSAFLFCFLIGVVIGEDASIGDSTQDSLVPVTIFVTTEQYRACKEYGDCTFTPQSVSLNESGEIQGELEGKSYFEICRKIHSKMEKLEAEHPEVKYLKLKLIQAFDSYFSELYLEPGKDQLVGVKILDFVKNFVEKLKVELKEKLLKDHKPKLISTVETTVEEEITAEPEPGHPMLVGSIKGIPGIHFPNYTEIPITSFSCSDKTLIPGFYADLETGCQVFHLCYEHRRESFLCPIGTIFNQPILACDYWYSANCSLAPIHYKDTNIPEKERIPIVVEDVKLPKHDIVTDFLKFLPVKAKVSEIPKFDKRITPLKLKPVTLENTEVIADKIFDGILSLDSHAISTASDKLNKLPDPQYKVPIVSKPFHIEHKLASKAFSAFGKAKKVTSASKLSAAVKMASVAAGKAKIASVPLIKAKVVSAAALPLLKTKMAAAAIPLVKVNAALMKKIPIVKGKLFTLPLAKTKLKAASYPAFKAKKTVAAVPYLKMAVLKPKFVMAPLKVKPAIALPIMKTKLAKAAISPLTKKALALGYLKLLKAKKLTVMG